LQHFPPAPTARLKLYCHQFLRRWPYAVSHFEGEPSLSHHFFDGFEKEDLTPRFDVARRSSSIDTRNRGEAAEVKAIICIASIALLLVVLSITLAEKSDRQWEDYAARHHCVDTGHQNRILGADFGKREWVCLNGESYWRH
jgi:hypothetical protein